MRSPAKITLSEQVVAYQRTRHPAARREIKAAILGLASGKGDVRALEEELEGFHRLRVGAHRIIFVIEPNGTIRCLFAEQRSVVYEIFSALLRERLE